MLIHVLKYSLPSKDSMIHLLVKSPFSLCTECLELQEMKVFPRRRAMSDSELLAGSPLLRFQKTEPKLTGEIYRVISKTFEKHQQLRTKRERSVAAEEPGKKNRLGLSVCLFVCLFV